MEMVAFGVLAVIALLSATVVVLHRNPIISALFLAMNLMSIAGLYLLLEAQFLALLQVIVYAGAIMVLILFVIMLLNLPAEDLHKSGFFQRTLSPLFGIGMAAMLVWAVSRGGDGVDFQPASPDYGTVAALGTDLFTRYYYPFEAISLLLIVAMIGAVLLAKRRL